MQIRARSKVRAEISALGAAVECCAYYSSDSLVQAARVPSQTLGKRCSVPQSIRHKEFRRWFDLASALRRSGARICGS
jgi:hypothetical protein